MKKKSFYNNKKRNKKWTEREAGRKIYFAEKYIPEGDGNNKFIQSRYKYKKPIFTKDNALKLLKYSIICIGSIFIIGVGYTIVDINMELRDMPETIESDSSQAVISDLSISVNALSCEPLSMDGSVMANAIISDVTERGYSAVCIDVKRNDGTIAYQSELATVEAFNAISAPASDLNSSVSLLESNDILTVARVSCYKDNIAPLNDTGCAIKNGPELYKDNSGHHYLNPDVFSSYSYIRGIIDEASKNGIKLFALDDYTLPKEISQDYNDGFEYISKKLYNDLGGNIKLFKAVSISISSDDKKEIIKQLSSKINSNDKDTIYFVTAKNVNVTKQYLDSKRINYIINE